MKQHKALNLDELESLHLAFCDEYKLLKAIIEEPVDHLALTRAKLKLEQRSKKNKLLSQQSKFVSYITGMNIGVSASDNKLLARINKAIGSGRKAKP